MSSRTKGGEQGGERGDKGGQEGVGFACSRLVPVVEGKGDEYEVMKKRVGKLYSWTCGWRAHSCSTSVRACLRRTPYSGVDFTGWVVNVPALEGSQENDGVRAWASQVSEEIMLDHALR